MCKVIETEVIGRLLKVDEKAQVIEKQIAIRRMIVGEMFPPKERREIEEILNGLDER